MSFVRAASSVARTAGALERALTASGRAIRETAHGVLAHALDRHERQQLGISLYEDHLDSVRTELMAWERAWLGEDLPPPPARVLVGGAGAGRELRALEAMGYTVGGLEPGPDAVGRCIAALSSRAIVACATYEQLAAVVLDGGRHPELEALVARPWDASILGWTSMMHVLDDAERSRLFATFDRITRGPILGTFYPTARAQRPGRPHALGARLGRAIGRARGVAAPGEAESFGFACGFLRGWTYEEVERRAGMIGRDVLWRGDDGCVRFTCPA